MIPEILKAQIDERAQTVDNLFESADDEFFWCIRVDDLKEILERYFKDDWKY